MTKKVLKLGIDPTHTLENFLDAYDDPAEMIVSEVIANALDVKASEIDITLDFDGNGGFITFYNNGKGMTKKQFDDYHVISKSSKVKGKGIGFAGIGAKIYLAKWDGAKIYTETVEQNSSLGSIMYKKDNELVFSMYTPKLKKSGTQYKVALELDDYNTLKSDLTGIVSKIFDPAIQGEIIIKVNKKKISPWNPETIFKKPFICSVSSNKFPIKLIVSKDEIPNSKRFIQYHVRGKIITTTKPDWIKEVKSKFQNNVHAYVDAMKISNQLDLSKNKFKNNRIGKSITKKIETKIYSELKNNDYIDERVIKNFPSTKLEKFFKDLFKESKYAFLNPNTIGGIGSSGSGGTIHSQKKKKNTNNEHNSKKNTNVSNRGGIKIAFSTSNDSRDGWLEQGTNRIVVNMDHPLFIKYQNIILARNQHVGAVVTKILITNATLKKEFDVNQAFELQTDILTKAKDVVW